MAKNDKKEESIDIDKKELEAISKIRDYRLIAEANVVSILWSNPDFYFDYDNLDIKSFIHNEWKVFFQIGYDIIVKEKKQTLDEITVNLYLEKHLKLREKYEEYGGFEVIDKAKKYVNIENIDGYIAELNKWKVVINLSKNNFPIADRLNEYVDMNVDEIYDEYEAVLNHIFVNVQGDGIRICDVADGLHELIAELNEGTNVGLPYYNMPMFTSETNGLLQGNFYMLFGSSGTGKSSFCRSLILPSILEKGEKICMMINEEDHKKTKTELMVWVSTNIFKADFQKYKINKGKFTDEDLAILKKSAEWLEAHKDQITIVAIDSYNTNKAIKIIKKYSSLGYVYFLIDTFKFDSDMKVGNNNWMDLQQNSVKLYDLIKPSARNLCLIITMQLTKQSIKQRCLTLESIAGAKNVADVASGCYMIRWVLPDEFEGERSELKVFKLAGKTNKTKIPVILDKNKKYQLLFMPKNRFGVTDDYVIVVEVDLSRNKYKEVGMTVVSPDW